MAKAPTPAPKPTTPKPAPAVAPKPAPAAAPKPAPAPAPAAAAPLFEIKVMGPPPARVSFGFGREPSPYTEYMLQLPLPDAGQYACFDVPVYAPEGITDAAEAAKAIKDEQRKLQNRIGGVARRIAKNDASFKVQLVNYDEDGVQGVRVFRVEAPEAAPAAE